MTNNGLSPLQVEVLLHHYYSPAPWAEVNPSPPAVERAIQGFLQDGLLAEREDDDGLYPTAKGMALIRSILQHPKEKSMPAQFNESYIVKMVILLGDDAVDYPAEELAKSLQALYDQDVAPAGFFKLEKIGTHLVVELERQIHDDVEVLEGNLTPESVVKQLAAEYQEAYDNTPEGQFGQTEKLAIAIQRALRENQVTVEGLPCQQVRVRLVAEWLLPATISDEQLMNKLKNQAEMVECGTTMVGAEREKLVFEVSRAGGEMKTVGALKIK